MNDFLPLCRRAFRALHGLPCAEAPPPLSGEVQVALLAWARGHRVLGLLQAGLPATSPSLQSAAFGQAQHTARLANEAERLFAILAPALPALTLVKGPALAAQAWPKPGLRSFDDLDFLCAPEDFPRLQEGLRAAGYLPSCENPRRMAHLWHYGWGVTFRHPEGGMVEANHRFFPPHYPWPRQLRATGLAGFTAQQVDAAAVRAPTPALHLLLSCEHAIWHGWTRLGWIADIAGLLAQHPGVFQQAHTLVCSGSFAERSLAAGCAVADALFGPGLAPTARTFPEIATRAAILLDRSAGGMSGTELKAFHERFMSHREILTYRFIRTFTPGDGDFQRLALPPALRTLYWLLRPVRGAMPARRQAAPPP